MSSTRCEVMHNGTSTGVNIAVFADLALSPPSSKQMLEPECAQVSFNSLPAEIVAIILTYAVYDDSSQTVKDLHTHLLLYVPNLCTPSPDEVTLCMAQDPGASAVRAAFRLNIDSAKTTSQVSTTFLQHIDKIIANDEVLIQKFMYDLEFSPNKHVWPALMPFQLNCFLKYRGCVALWPENVSPANTNQIRMWEWKYDECHVALAIHSNLRHFFSNFLRRSSTKTNMKDLVMDQSD